MSTEFKSHILRNSAVAGVKPAAAELFPGELAVNFADQKLYTKSPSGLILDLTPLTGIVSIIGAVDGDVLVYSAAEGKYINMNLSEILDGGTY